MTPIPVFRAERNVLLLACVLFFGSHRPVRAEGTASYKYEDYRESGGRVAVQTQGVLLEDTLGSDFKVRLGGVIDAIAGATPNGRPAPAGTDDVVLVTLHERRKAWNADFSRQFPRVNVALGVANSRESDYVSTGWSLNTLTDFNRKNTTLLAGFAFANDDIKAFYASPSPTVGKRTRDFIAGVTQLLDPRTVVSFNLTFGQANGFLNDQYKLVQKRVEVIPGIFLSRTFPENRPDRRDKWIARVAFNRAYPALRGAVEGSYRFYRDTFGTNAHTLDLSWLQRVGSRLIVQPQVRWYRQSAADFYYYDLDRTPLIPVFGGPRPAGPFFSSDYRLSNLTSWTTGLKAAWQLNDHLEINAALTGYRMRGNDGITPQSAYARATIATGGLKFTW